MTRSRDHDELRFREAINLRRDDIDLEQSRVWVRRPRNGLAIEQPITGDELRAINRDLATHVDRLPWPFLSERGQILMLPSDNAPIAFAARRAGLPPVPRRCCGTPGASPGRIVATIRG